ncbi:hypothetical protein Tco_1061981, partial [Tanacetum coccineum]
KRYRGTSELILDTDNEGDELGDEDIKEDESLDADDERERSNDKGHRLDDEGRGLEGEGLTVSEPLGLGYGAARRHALESIEEIAPSTYEVDPEDDSIYTDILIYPPIAPVQTLLSLEWSSGSLPISPSSLVVPSPIASPDHTQRLDTLPPTLIADIDRDVRELYTRSRVVRDEIFSQRYMFKSLEHEQERTAVAFRALWRPMLVLEAWAGHVDT